MIIIVGTQDYELNTKLGTARKIEDKFKVPLNQLFSKLGEATVEELATLLAIAAGDNVSAPEFKAGLLTHWDYSDLYNAVQELVAKLMFSGTPKQIEAKLVKYPVSEEVKNMFRGLLGMPQTPEDSIGNES